MATVSLVSSNNIVFAVGISYLGLGNCHSLSSATEADVQITHHVPGILSNLWVFVSANSQTTTVTIRTRKNAGNGAQAISVLTTATGEFEDTTNTDIVSDTEKWNYQVDASAGANTITIKMMSILFAANTTTSERLACVGSTTFASASVSSFMQLCGLLTTFNSTENRSESRFNTSGSLKNLFVYISANARTTATTFRTRKNTANGAQSVSVGNIATGVFEDTTNTDTIVTEDLVNFGIATGTGTQTITIKVLAVDFVTGNNTFQFACGDCNAGGNVNQAQTFNFPISGNSNLATATENNVAADTNLAFIGSNLTCFVRTNTLSVTLTARLRVNAANVNQSIAILTTTTGMFEDAVSTDNVAQPDEINYVASAPAGTGVANVMTFGMLATVIAVPRRAVMDLGNLGVL